MKRRQRLRLFMHSASASERLCILRSCHTGKLTYQFGVLVTAVHTRCTQSSNCRSQNMFAGPHRS